MSQIYNIYCDESCHLENDKQKAMVLGAVWCPVEKIKEISKRIREFKEKHGINRKFEIKWTKVSHAKINSQINFYLDIVDYFFDNDDLHFRCLVVEDKSRLNHNNFGQTHDEWYYKMYFDMLKVILNPESRYKIYLDIKDTRGGEKIKKLREVLCHNMYDFNHEIIEGTQLVRSEEIELIQVCDLLIGAMGYFYRGLKSNEGKMKIIERIKERSGYGLEKSTLYKEEKFNVFIWKASEL